MHIIKQGGVVRTLESWGTHSLPYRMKQQQLGECVHLVLFPIHSHACNSYWTLHFDTSPRTVKSLNNFLRRDPLVLRWTVLKKAEKAEDVATAGRKLIHPILKDVELTEKTTKT